MPPKKDNLYDPLPDLAALPGEDNRFYNEMYNDSGDQQAPQDVVSDVSQATAAQEIPQTGMRFDFGSLNVQTKEDFNALPDEVKELLRTIKYSRVIPTPEGAAQFVLRERERRQKLTDSMQDPVKQAQLSEKQSKMAAANQIQRDFAVKRQTTLNNINEILKNKDEYAQLVGPWDGSAGAVIDSIGVNEDRQAKRAKLSRLLFQDVLELTKYLRPTTEKDLELAQKNVPGRFQNWPVFEDYLNEKKQMLLSSDRALVDPASNQPLSIQGAAPQQPNVYQQSQQNPASQLRSQFESSDTLTLPNGRVLKKVTNADGSIGWSE